MHVKTLQLNTSFEVTTISFLLVSLFSISIALHFWQVLYNYFYSWLTPIHSLACSYFPNKIYTFVDKTESNQNQEVLISEFQTNMYPQDKWGR